jgi:hypothetical protein
MKPNPRAHATRFLLSATLLFACPFLLIGQSKKNNNPPPPPPPQQQQRNTPPPAPSPQQRPAQQQPQRPPQTPSGKQPVVNQPGKQPVVNQPGKQPVVNQPGKQPVVNQPGKQPVVNQPGKQPVVNQPGKQPVVNQPGKQPVVNQPGKLVTLQPAESKKQIESLNANRATMTGINRNSVPPGQVTVHPNGAKTIAASGGRQFDLRPDGTVHKISLSDGKTATFHQDGTVNSIRTKDGIQIDRSVHGSRTIVSERNGQRIVSTGAARGYLQRPYVNHDGRTYVQRTYVVNNNTYVSVYRTYSFRNVTYYNYVPVYYYQPVFYGWVYNPWPAPVYFTWGWSADPWYAPYGYYFTPYPVYPSAAYWMTDYIIAENLRAAYEAGAADANARNERDSQPQRQNNSAPLSPEVKEMIAEEVKAQLAAEREAATQSSNASNAPSAAPASSGGNAEQAPPALDPNVRVFVVTTRLDVSAAGQDCSLSPGDVLTRTEDTPDAANTVGVSVVSSQKTDCRMGSTPRIQVADLQEMHNQFREKMDSGLKTLAEKQGKGGLPTAPSVRTVSGEVPPPTADSTIAAKKIKGQQQEADQTEKEIQQQAFTDRTS